LREKGETDWKQEGGDNYRTNRIGLEAFLELMIGDQKFHSSKLRCVSTTSSIIKNNQLPLQQMLKCLHQTPP
jgi:hypothetical protein